MRIPLDRTGATPLVRQVEAWLRDRIVTGALPEATRLPSTRELAADLGISRITATNAYRALEADGLLVGRPGSGSFVAARPPVPPPPEDAGREWPRWQRELIRADRGQDGDAVGQSRRDDVISFTGVGDPRWFPLAGFARTMKEVLRQDGSAALEYGDFDRGHGPLRTTVTQVLASQGIRAVREQVLVTTGSQQALALTCQVLLRPGDAVVAEAPTYNLALDLFRALGIRVLGVPVDAEGMQVERVEPLLQQHRPRLIYTIPNFQNPSGATLGGSRRRQLLALSERYDVPILEDDFAGDLRYDGRAQPAIKALDRTGQVIYAGTFAKLLMPGLRVGYLVADGPVLDRLTEHKRVHDLTTSPLLQRVVDRYVTVGRYQAHLRRTTRLGRARRDAIVAALSAHLPAATVTRPHGGLFVWVQMPAPISTRALLDVGLRAGVEFAPGDQFFADPVDGDAYLRLNFATHTPDDIARGVTRLATALARYRRRVRAG